MSLSSFSLIHFFCRAAKHSSLELFSCWSTEHRAGDMCSWLTAAEREGCAAFVQTSASAVLVVVERSPAHRHRSATGCCPSNRTRPRFPRNFLFLIWAIECRRRSNVSLVCKWGWLKKFRKWWMELCACVNILLYSDRKWDSNEWRIVKWVTPVTLGFRCVVWLQLEVRKQGFLLKAT